MHYVGSFFRAVGYFWGITILTVVSAAIVIGGLTAGGYLFAHNVAAPLSKSLAQQRANNNYQVNQESQQYQQTYLSEITSGMAALNVDKRQYLVDKEGTDKNLIAEDVVEMDAQAGKLCGYGQYIDSVTEETMDPTTIAWFKANCNSGVVSPNSEYVMPATTTAG
jgi:hypothetical protein